MLLFRSEEHVGRWCEERGLERGGSMSPETALRLGVIWYADKQQPGWRRKTIEEAEAIFGELGLVGNFWRLRP
jgi:hypothetical protein